MRPDMHDRCFEHARLSARRGTMKGLDPEVLASALTVQAMMAVFQIDEERALVLAMHAIAYAREMLIRFELDGVPTDELQLMKSGIDARRDPWEIVVDSAVSAVEARLGKLDLLGSAAVLPGRKGR